MMTPVGASGSVSTRDVSTPSPRMRNTTARPNSSSPTRLIQPAEWPRRLRPTATLHSAPAMWRRKVVASRIGPACSASSSTIVSLSVTRSSISFGVSCYPRFLPGGDPSASWQERGQPHAPFAKKGATTCRSPSSIRAARQMMSSIIPARLEYQCGHAALVSLPRIKGETSAQRTQRVALEKSAALARQCDFCAPVVEVIQPVVPEPIAAAGDIPVATFVLETAVDGMDGQQVNGTEPVIAAPEQAEPATATGPRVKLRATRTARARTRDATRDRRQFLVQYRVERLVQAVDVRDALRQAASLGATDVLEIARQD